MGRRATTAASGGTAQIVRYYLGGPLPGARRASDNLRQMLSGDDDSLVLHLPVRAQSRAWRRQPATRAALAHQRRTSTAGARMPPDYRRIFERMQVFERDRLKHVGRRVDARGRRIRPSARGATSTRMAVGLPAPHHAAMRAIHGLAALMGLAFLLYSDLGRRTGCCGCSSRSSSSAW